MKKVKKQKKNQKIKRKSANTWKGTTHVMTNKGLIPRHFVDDINFDLL